MARSWFVQTYHQRHVDGRHVVFKSAIAQLGHKVPHSFLLKRQRPVVVKLHIHAFMFLPVWPEMCKQSNVNLRNVFFSIVDLT